MNARRVSLEVLSAAPADGAVPGTLVLPAEALEETKLAAFEQGYKAGWDDAAAAQGDEEQRLRDEVARNLQALSFSYHEARAHLLQGLAPLIDQICARVVPAIAQEAIGAVVREALMPLAEEAADLPVRLAVNPEARGALEAALAGAVTPPVEIVEDAGLTPGQVLLQAGDSERRVDLDAAVAAIRNAVAAHFLPSAAAPSHAAPSHAAPSHAAPSHAAPHDAAQVARVSGGAAPDAAAAAPPGGRPAASPAPAEGAPHPVKDHRRHG